MKKTTRLRLNIAGRVQGVGFRPFVYRLAFDGELTGLVGNSSAGVVVEAQGDAEKVEVFLASLQNDLPPLAEITTLRVEEIPVLEGESGFSIAASEGGGGHNVLISPDVAVCADCLADMADTKGRRHDYAFTNCTNCGPRFTITKSIPYDRAVTSMACFEMCPACLAEYRDPLNRRFHAQPNACPVCGPGLLFVGPESVSDFCTRSCLQIEDFDSRAMESAVEALAAGKILAVKGLGGFHLACDAFDEAAVAELRRRKNRPHKPLAVMVKDMETARSIALIDARAEHWLTSRQAPITLCPVRDGGLPYAISPDSRLVGLMLPYTPLHHVLLGFFAESVGADRPAALVMTSGNAGGDPICLGNREALDRLGDLADAFLLHNRDILTRIDDSVVMPSSSSSSSSSSDTTGEPDIFYRRARGYVPGPIRIANEKARLPSIMGLGAELKATICLNRGNEAFVSQHTGDLQNAAVYGFYREAADYLSMLLQTRPEICVCDSHPDYLSTRYAEESGLPVLRLQHHFAHAFSVLGENWGIVFGEGMPARLENRPALVLALDGTGLGDDGTIWGGELLMINPATLEMRRMGRLSLFDLPGGEAAIREPWRIAEGLLAGIGEEALMAARGQIIRQMVARGVNCPKTSSCGRLFDAVSALLGLCDEITYEGQAAIRLENCACAVAAPASGGLTGGVIKNIFVDISPYEVRLRENGSLLELSSQDLFAAVLEDLRVGTPVPLVAARFHLSLARGFAAMAASRAKACGAEVVGLSGGVMQNATLLRLLMAELEGAGLIPLTHKVLPPNDGCISFGQVCYGLLR